MKSVDSIDVNCMIKAISFEDATSNKVFKRGPHFVTKIYRFYRDREGPSFIDDFRAVSEHVIQGKGLFVVYFWRPTKTVKLYQLLCITP